MNFESLGNNEQESGITREDFEKKEAGMEAQTPSQEAIKNIFQKGTEKLKENNNSES